MKVFKVLLLTVIGFVQLWSGSCSKTENEIGRNVLGSQRGGNPKEPLSNAIGTVPSGNHPSVKPVGNAQENDVSSKNHLNSSTHLQVKSSSIKAQTIFLKPQPGNICLSTHATNAYIHAIAQHSLKGILSGTEIWEGDMLKRCQPEWVRRYTYFWPNGRLTFTYYSYMKKVYLITTEQMVKVLNYIRSVGERINSPPKGLFQKLKSKLLDQCNSINPNDDEAPNLYYGSRYPVRKNSFYLEKVQSSVERHHVVVRVVFRWPGNALAITYYGFLYRQPAEFIRKIWEVGNYTLDDLYSKVHVHLVDDQYLTL